MAAFCWRGLERALARSNSKGSDFLQLIGRVLAGATILRDFVADLLAFAQIAQARALDGADMNENIRAAIVGLNKSEAFLTVEPLDDSGSHVTLQACFIKLARMRGAGSIDVWKRSSAALSPKQVQVVRPKIDDQAIVMRAADCNVETRQRQINLEIAPRPSAAPRARRTDWRVLGRLGDLAADLAASIADDIAPGADREGASRSSAGQDRVVDFWRGLW